MSFDGKQAIVTGAGSGIGAALCRALAAAGADVVCTDVDGDAAERTASALGARARSARLDVTDAAAVQAVVDDVVARAGRLDLMFNNAGIVWGGDTELLTLDQWNAIIDVNIRGVVHGVAAAYPQMVRQGHGHIVNTASMAGLTAAGQITSYVTTKHAVVGLSLALRSEAAAHGVGVLVRLPVGGRDPDSGQGRDRRIRRPRLLSAGPGREDGVRRRPPCTGHVEGHRAQQGAAGQTAPRTRPVGVRTAGAGTDAAHVDSASSRASGPARRRNARTFAEQIGFPAAQPGYGMPVAAMDTEFTLTQKRALAIATVLAILFAAFFLRRYFILIVVAAVVAYLFSPLYNRLKKRLGTGCFGHAHPVGCIRKHHRAAGPDRTAGGHSDHGDGQERRRLGRTDRPVHARRQDVAICERYSRDGCRSRTSQSPRTCFGRR